MQQEKDEMVCWLLESDIYARARFDDLRIPMGREPPVNSKIV